jgi:hypothetical protein
MLGAVLAAAVLAAAHPGPRVTVKVPRPGGIELRVVQVDATLRHGQVAPPHLTLQAATSPKLPGGLAYVGTIRRLRHAKPHRASYLGLVAVVPSAAPVTARAAQNETEPDALSGILSTVTLQHRPDFKVRSRPGFHIETRRNSDSDELEDVLVPDGYRLASTRSTGDPRLVSATSGTTLRDLTELNEVDRLLGELTHSGLFDDNHAFSWTVKGNTPDSSPVDDHVVQDILALLDGHKPVAEVTGDLVGNLNELDPGGFGKGAVPASQPPPKQVTCRVSADFTITAPPSDGLSFEGPAILAVPAAAISPRGLLTDPATSKAPTAAPWAGVTFKTSYEGRARNGADPADHWEYVIEFDGSGSASQPIGPNRTWTYTVTYALEADACPPGAKAVR